MTMLYWIFVFLMFGLCIIIHELGHLLVAIWCGLKPERFSVGFGPKLFGFTYKNVEFIISAIPFGGYVALPQLEPTDKPTDSKGNVLPAASPMARLLTAFAGPFANIILGFVLATVITIIGVYRQAPQSAWTISQVPQFIEPMPDEIGLKQGDKIISINQKAVNNQWAEFWNTLSAEDLQRYEGKLKIKINREPLLGKSEEVILDVTPKKNPEYEAGLRQGDVIIAINNQPIEGTVEDFMHAMLLGEKTIQLTIRRQDEVIQLPAYTPAKNANATGLQIPHFSLDINAGILNKQGKNYKLPNGETIKTITAIGNQSVTGLTQIQSSCDELIKTYFQETHKELTNVSSLNHLVVPLQVITSKDQKLTLNLSVKASQKLGIVLNNCQVIEDAYASKLATLIPESDKTTYTFLPGDIITKINQTSIQNYSELIQAIQQHATNDKVPLKITVKRNDSELVLERPTYCGFDYFMDNKSEMIPVVFGSNVELWHPSPWSQFSVTINRTIQTLKGLFANKVRAQDMSGPVGIFQMTYIKVKNESFRGGLSFIIMISFSLAFFNLLPLPVLDGGHIVFSLIELVTRKQLPTKLIVILQNAFAIFLIGFALYVTFYDVIRVLRFNGITQRIETTEITEPAQPE